jgi:hypothetical protein
VLRVYVELLQMGVFIRHRHQRKTYRLIVFSKCDPQSAVLLRLLQPPERCAVGAQCRRQILDTEELCGGVFDRR